MFLLHNLDKTDFRCTALMADNLSILYGEVISRIHRKVLQGGCRVAGEEGERTAKPVVFGLMTPIGRWLVFPDGLLVGGLLCGGKFGFGGWWGLKPFVIVVHDF